MLLESSASSAWFLERLVALASLASLASLPLAEKAQEQEKAQVKLFEKASSLMYYYVETLGLYRTV
jgi:hypothetical protein